MDSKRATWVFALIVLVCFFLPWVQVSCGGARDTLSGVDLARDGRNGLWLVPLLMVAVLLLGMARVWKERRDVSALVNLIAGLVSAYLMNRERLRAEDRSAVLAVQLTGWFWLGLGATIALIAVSILRVFKRTPKDRQKSV